MGCKLCMFNTLKRGLSGEKNLNNATELKLETSACLYTRSVYQCSTVADQYLAVVRTLTTNDNDVEHYTVVEGLSPNPLAELKQMNEERNI